MGDTFDVALDPNADDMVAADDDATDRLKRLVTVRKGRGFTTGESGRSSVLESDEFETSVSVESGRAMRSIEGWIIFVTGIHEEATEESVTEKFADFGKIKNIHLNLDRRTGYLKGYAMIEYGSFKEAQDAITALDGTNFLGQKIRCDFAFVKPTNQSGGGSGSGGNRSGRRSGGRRKDW